VQVKEQKGVADLSPEQVAEIKRLFTVIDRNGDGSLNAEEIYQVLREMGKEVTQEEVN
jgi:Ca2+-binding EF-hand superfamily protein